MYESLKTWTPRFSASARTLRLGLVAGVRDERAPAPIRGARRAPRGGRVGDIAAREGTIL